MAKLQMQKRNFLPEKAYMCIISIYSGFPVTFSEPGQKRQKPLRDGWRFAKNA